MALLGGVAEVAHAQSAQAVLNKMLKLESQRAKGVDNYAMDATVMGHEHTLYYERVSIRGPDGKPMQTFRLVSFGEMQSRQQAGQGMSPAAWEEYSKATRQTGAAVDGEMEKGMNEAGLPPGMRDAMGSGAEDEPWASPNPSTMMGSMAELTHAAGKASAEAKADARNDDMARSMALFKKRAKIVGKESVGKRRAIHARAEGLNIVEKSDGEELEIQAISLWIDAEKYVPLKMRMEGVAKQGRNSREIVIERLDQDYRSVPGSKLYMPHRNLMRMQGVLSPEQQKQMEDARKQLADFDKQLAAMPPEQRAQVERMAGSQMAMLRKMVDRGELDVVTEVRAIRVNVGLEGAVAGGAAMAGGSGSGSGGKPQSLEEAQKACLQAKIDAAKKEKRAFGRVMKVAADTASRYGGGNVSSEVERASQEAYKVDATGKDLEEAADALGLSKEDVENCRNPS